MRPDLRRKDLILLVADKDIEFSLRGLLSRPQSLKCRPVSFELVVHPEHDPGCLRRAHEMLQSSAGLYERALVILDHAGSGREAVERSVLESEIELRLGEAGWENRAAAVVISPELENWVWSDSPHIDRALGWSREIPLRDWLREKGVLSAGATKPANPKDAVDLVLRTVCKPHSSSIYLDLAQSVTTNRCSDPAFLKLKACLQSWFPPPSTAS